MKRNLAAACALTLALALTACSGGNPSQGGSTSQTPAGSGSTGAVSGTQSTPDTSGEDTQPEAAKTPLLYIGMDGQFEEYPLALEEEATPEVLVQGIAALTGWDLSLADGIASGKGGMTVVFAEDCALFSGPPDPQKDEFHVFDAGQLDRTILDSIQKTLQNWAVVPGLGDPDSVDIYFCGPDGGDLVLENLGITIPCTEPYSGFPEPS